jgi:hypothetical protein
MRLIPINEGRKPEKPAAQPRPAPPPGNSQRQVPPTAPVSSNADLERKVKHAMAELHEEVERLARRVGQLEDTLGKHDRVLQVLSQNMTEQAGLIAANTGRQDEQDERLARTAQTLTHYAEAMDTLRARLFIEDRTLTDADFLVHYEIGERLKRLFTQRLRDLASPGASDGPEGADGSTVLMREARQVRLMCQALFEGGEPDLEGLTAIVTDSGQVMLSEEDSRLLERVKQEAVSLRKDIEGNGHPYMFIFNLSPDTVADPGQHVLWTSAVAGEPVAFVVTPGYVVSGRRILASAVITGPREAQR